MEWINDNLRKGVREEFIIMSLEMNGVEKGLAERLVQRTKEEGGELRLGNTFADLGKGYIYVIKS